MASARSSCSDAGFSLVETLVAMAIFSVVALGVAQLFAVATQSNGAAKLQTSATTLAEQKMEQLRGLMWGFDSTGLGLPVSDTASNLSKSPADATGAGLNPSPAGTLTANVAGYHDYLGLNGEYLGTGGGWPPTAVFVRRWSIEPLPTNPNNTLIFQVYVATKANVEMGRVRGPGDAWLVSIKTRKATCANGSASC